MFSLFCRSHEMAVSWGCRSQWLPVLWAVGLVFSWDAGLVVCRFRCQSVVECRFSGLSVLYTVGPCGMSFSWAVGFVVCRSRKLSVLWSVGLLG